MTANEWMVLLVFVLNGLGDVAKVIAIISGMGALGSALLWVFAVEDTAHNEYIGRNNKKNEVFIAVSKRSFKLCCWVFPFALLFAALAPAREHVKYAACYFIAKQGVESFSESTIGKALMERAAEEIKEFGKEAK